MSLQPYEPQVQFDEAPFGNGCHGDLLLMVLHNFLLSTQWGRWGLWTATSLVRAGSNSKLAPLYECILTIIVNGEEGD